MKKTSFIPLVALMLLLVTGLAAPSLAHGGDDDNRSSGSGKFGDDSDEHDQDEDDEHNDDDQGRGESDDDNENDDDSDGHHRQRGRTDQQRQRVLIAERRQSLHDRLEKKQAERHEKLAGKRLETCQNRQDRINQLIQKSAENARKKLAVFQKIEEGVREFYTSKNLSSDDFAAAAEAADAAEVKAVAALDVMAETRFDCGKADGQRPGGVIKSVVQERNAALKSYKRSVQALIVVVKQSLSGDATNEQTNEDTAETEQAA